MLSSSSPPILLSLLTNKVRWQLVSSLVKSDFSVQELQRKLRKSQNLISYHLNRLKTSKLISETRSIADGREVYYSLNLSLLQSLYFTLGDSLHPALSKETEEQNQAKRAKKVRVLFVCTHNSARSQMAEGLLREKGGDIVEVFSAGTEPSTVNPYAIKAMDGLSIDIRGQRSKGLEEFLGKKFEYVITVCDRAKESCPIFPGAPEQIHWSFPDPAEVSGGEETKSRAFHETALQLSQRISFLLMMIERK